MIETALIFCLFGVGAFAMIGTWCLLDYFFKTFEKKNEQ